MQRRPVTVRRNAFLHFAFCIRRGDPRAAPIRGSTVDLAWDDGNLNVDVLSGADR